jgi:hypothetical protein
MSVATITDAAEVQETIAHKDYRWTLEAKQKQGTLWLYWSTTAPFRAQQGQISVYATSFPLNPEDNRKVSNWDNDNGGGAGWNTNLPRGSGWNCTWIAQRSPNGPYTYVVTLTTTELEKT